MLSIINSNFCATVLSLAPKPPMFLHFAKYRLNFLLIIFLSALFKNKSFVSVFAIHDCKNCTNCSNVQNKCLIFYTFTKSLSLFGGIDTSNKSKYNVFDTKIS